MKKVKKRNKRIGQCKICGNNGKLTFEHVPPRSAFNEIFQEEYTFEKVQNFFKEGKARYKPKQKGSGDHYLCGNCNNLTGSWYVDAFKEWNDQVAKLLYSNPIEKGVLPENTYELYPLRTFKQIISMFLCINHKSFYSDNNIRKDLVDFLLDKDNNAFPEGIKVYFYGHSPYSTFARRISETVVADLLEHKEKLVASEISLISSGYIMTEEKNINKLKFIPFSNFIDITFFSKYLYNEKLLLELLTPVAPNHTLTLCDFRTRKEINSVIPNNQIMFGCDEDIKGIRPKRK